MKITAISGDMAVKVAMGAGVILALYLVAKKIGSAASGAVTAVTAVADQAITAADTAVSTPVLGIGDAVGIPRTNLSQCDQAMAEGRTWDASFSCPAATFMKYVWNGAPPQNPTVDMPTPAGHSAYWKS